VLDDASRPGSSLASRRACRKKHVGVLEQAGLVSTEKIGRVRTCKLGARRLEEESAWRARYRQLWNARFDELDKVVDELKRKERSHGRKQSE
jgi:DNA-binding transcriptional ArsR family regulator